jgi:ATP-dependent Clp protease ATP-binding subunit ClpA
VQSRAKNKSSDRQQSQVEFEVNEFYEALLLLRRDEITRFNKLSEATRRTVEHYALAKARAEKQAA